MRPNDHRPFGAVLLVGMRPPNAAAPTQGRNRKKSRGRAGATTVRRDAKRRGTLVAGIFLLFLGSIDDPLWAQSSSAPQASDENQTSLWTEAGYVLAMETVFTGMSLLGSQQGNWGPAITGGADLLIAVAGLENGSLREPGVQKTGHYLISAGFAAKALYNFRLGRDHSRKAQFWTNLIGYNVLVFFGYFLDTL